MMHEHNWPCPNDCDRYQLWMSYVYRIEICQRCFYIGVYFLNAKKYDKKQWERKGNGRNRQKKHRANEKCIADVTVYEQCANMYNAKQLVDTRQSDWQKTKTPNFAITSPSGVSYPQTSQDWIVCIFATMLPASRRSDTSLSAHLLCVWVLCRSTKGLQRWQKRNYSI